MGLGKQRFPLWEATQCPTPSSGQGPPWHRPSPNRCLRHPHAGVKPHICSWVQAIWKSPARSGLEPLQRWARQQLPGAGCCWQSDPAAPSQISASPSDPHTQSEEQTETAEDLCPGNLWEDDAFSLQLCSPPCLTSPATSLGCQGMPASFLRGKQTDFTG